MATRRVYEFETFRLDPAQRRIEKQGEAVALNAKAFDALVYLVEHAGEPVSRRALTEALWPKRVVEENNLTQAISALRRALGESCIATLAGRGYQFVAEVRAVDVSSSNEAANTAERSNPDIEPAPVTIARADPTTLLGVHPLRTRRALLVAVSLAVAAVLAVAVYFFPSRTERAAAAATDGEPVKILVLPFDTLSQASEQQAIANGLTEDLIGQLQALPGLRVMGRATAFALRDSTRTVPEMVAEFGVHYVLGGSVDQDGDLLRIRGQLSDASGFSIWNRTYERPLASIFEIQDEIVGAIAAELPSTLGLEPAPRRASASSPEAYQLYLEARFIATRSAGSEAGARAFALLERSLQLDSRFAPSWTQKSIIHATRFQTFLVGAEAEAELAAAEQAAEQAIQLAPDQGDGYSARALVRLIRRDWLGAERDWAEARTLGYRADNYGFLPLATGRLENAREWVAESLERDPWSPVLLGFLMLSHELLGDTESADAVFERGSILFPPWLQGVAFSNWILLGRRDIEAISKDPARMASIPLFAKLIGDPDAVVRLNEMAQDPEYQSPIRLANLAIWAAYYGDARLALRSLEGAVEGAGSLAYLSWLPVFDDVRQMPEFKGMLERVGLVQYWRATSWPDVCHPVGRNDFACD